MKIKLPRPALRAPACFSAFAAPVLIAVSGCDRPADSPASPDESSQPAENISKPEPAPAKAPTPVAAPEPEPAESLPAFGSVEPILEIKETGKTIVISGHLSSVYQTKDIVDGLSGAFPEHKVTSELDVGDHVKPVQGWGNRVAELLIPLVQSAEDARFHYKDGVVTLEGTVPSKMVSNNLQRLTIHIMEDNDSQGIENKLKVAE